MGYRIQYRDVEMHDIGVSTPVAQLLERLRTKPHDLFGRPYAGYMIWLAGAGHQGVLEWLAENLTALDALTGELVAFAILAQEFRFPAIRKTTVVRTSEREARSHAFYLKELEDTRDLKELGGSWQVSPLGPSLEPLWTAKRTELAAVTYAAESIATKLGIVDQLPCVLFFDAVESADYALIKLDPAGMSEFMGFLRFLMHTLNEDGRAQSFLGQVEMLGAIERRLYKLQRDESSLLYKVSRLEAQAHKLETSNRPRILAVASALQRGNVRQLHHHLHRRRRPTELDDAACTRVLETATANINEVRRTARNILALEGYLPKEWPLPEEIERRYRSVLTEHIFPAFPDLSAGFDYSSRRDCETALLRARTARDSFVQSVLGLSFLPIEQQWQADKVALADERQSHHLELQKVREEIRKVEDTLSPLALHLLSEDGAPSFSRIAKQCAKRQRLRSVSLHLQKEVRGLASAVSPELLKRFAKLLAGVP